MAIEEDDWPIENMKLKSVIEPLYIPQYLHTEP